MRNTNTSFNFRFTAKYFNRDLNSKFESIEDLKSYFLLFRKHYDNFTNSFDPESSKRMNGKSVNNYKTRQEYSCALNDHYGLLLTIGTNGFNIWLNDLMK
jgi:hypothetical protein